MRKEIFRQHPLFFKYTRQWLHKVTGYSKGHLCRMATGRMPLSRAFIERVCYRLRQPEEELFCHDGTHLEAAVD